MKQKTLLIAMLAIVMAACGDKQQEVAPQAYPVVAVEQSAVEITDDYPATIRGRQDIEIYPQVSGKIVEVAVAQAWASKLSVEASVLTLKKQIRAQENSLSALLGHMSATRRAPSRGCAGTGVLQYECSAFGILPEHNAWRFGRVDQQQRRGNHQSGQLVA